MKSVTADSLPGLSTELEHLHQSCWRSVLRRLPRSILQLLLRSRIVITGSVTVAARPHDSTSHGSTLQTYETSSEYGICLEAADHLSPASQQFCGKNTAHRLAAACPASIYLWNPPGNASLSRRTSPSCVGLHLVLLTVEPVVAKHTTVDAARYAS